MLLLDLKKLSTIYTAWGYSDDGHCHSKCIVSTAVAGLGGAAMLYCLVV